MTRSFLVTFPLLIAFAAAPLVSRADGDPKAGQEKAATCVACHGADGIGADPSYPTLAGQYPSYLEHALQSYRSGARQNAIMAGFAAPLSDQDIADLAAWFASQSGPLRTAPTP